jgi:hypothetical protein
MFHKQFFGGTPARRGGSALQNLTPKTAGAAGQIPV